MELTHIKPENWIKREGALRRDPPNIPRDARIEVLFRDGRKEKGLVRDFYWACSFQDKDVMEFRVLDSN